MNPDEIDNIEEVIEDTPEEVTDFLVGEDFDVIKQKLHALIPNEEEFIGLENALSIFIINSQDFEPVTKAVDTLSISEENKNLVKKIIKEDIIDDLKLLIEVHTEMDADAEKSTKTSSVDVMKRLGESFTTAATIAPIKRTYSDIPSAPVPSNGPKSISETIPSSSSTKPASDPYRENPNDK